MVKKVWDDPNYQAKQAQKQAARKRGRQPATQAHQLHQGRQPGHPAGVPMHYAPGHGLTPQMGGHDGCTVPQLGQAAPVVASQGDLVPVNQPYGNALVKRQPEGVSELVGLGARKATGAVSRWSWRNRWQLTPLIASSGVAITAAIDPATAIIATGTTAGVAGLAQWKGPDKIRGRAWLSRLERGIAWRYAAAASAWSAAVLAGLEPLSVWGVGTLAAATGVQTVSWMRSRSIRKGEHTTAEDVTKLSQKALDIMATWPVAVGAFGPRGLLGSQLIDATEPITEVPEGETPEKTGTIILTAELRRTVHANDVDNEENRNWLERELKQGIGTVRLEKDRDDASRIKIILTPTRHLESTSKVWPGPVVTADGRIPIAVTPEGNTIYVRLWNETGINHLLLVGSSGSGKSNTYNVLLLPGVLSRKVVLIYLDGKKGGSNPKLAQAMDMVARTTEERKAATRMVHAILESREERYGEMGLDEFDPNGPDPIIMFVIDEANGVKDDFTAAEEAMVTRIAQKGRSLGIACWMSVQSAKMISLPGGGDTRQNLTGTVGNVVAMRAGDHSAKSVSLSSTSENIDLLGLPEGPGWCAILNGGSVAAKEARILHIPPGAEGAALFAKHIPADFVPRGLTGEDARAAGVTYAQRTTGRAWLAGMAAARIKAGRAREGDYEIVAKAALEAPVVPAELEQPVLPIEGTTSTPAATGHEGAPTSYAPVAAGASNQMGLAPVDADQKGQAMLGQAMSGAQAASAAAFAVRCDQALHVIANNHAGITHAAIALETEIPKSTLSRVLDRLEENGQIYKTEAGLWQASINEKAA